MKECLRFMYKNHRGETELRKVMPLNIWFGATKWHDSPQWFLKAVCQDRKEERDFPLDWILPIGPDCPNEDRVRELKRAMEE